MDEVHSQGRKALLSIVLAVFCSTVLLGFSELSTTSSDSTFFLSSPPVNIEAGIRHDIVGYAKNYLGLKYRYAGRTPETGFDCSGFTHFVMGTFGISVSPSSAQQSTQGESIKVKDTQTGDLIFFRRSPRSRISHVAMVVSNDENGLFIIHSTYRGIVIDDLMRSSYWRPKIHSARRVINANQKDTLAAIRALSGCDGYNEEAEEALDDDALLAEAAPHILNERFYCLEPLPTLPLQGIPR